MSARRFALACDMERAAIDAQALAQRLAVLGGVGPSVAAHAGHVDSASRVLRQAAEALHGGSTEGLRLFFGDKETAGGAVSIGPDQPMPSRSGATGEGGRKMCASG